MPQTTGPRTQEVVSFGPFRLYSSERLLKKGDQPVKLGSRAFNILLVLVEHAGEVVGHKELVAKVWPGVFVEEVSLRVHIAALRKALDAKSREFWPLVKTGRTHLQDATPIRLGQEFRGYAGQMEESVRRARAAIEELARVPLGGTAVGTGLNSHPQYARLASVRLAKATGIPVRETSNHFHAQATLDVMVATHGALRTIATSLWKIGSDVRLMGTGPIAGLGELRLPETQPGSSIMPGKVNPVIVESLTMAIARVYGNDLTVTICGQSGSLFELNVMMPVAGVATLESIALLAASSRNFAERCIDGLQATDRGPELVERSPMLATALNPVIGYDEAAKIAKESIRTGRSIRQLARGRGVSEPALTKVLDLGKMTKPGLEGPGGGG